MLEKKRIEGKQLKNKISHFFVHKMEVKYPKLDISCLNEQQHKLSNEITCL
jgi:hypothetical protein